MQPRVGGDEDVTRLQEARTRATATGNVLIRNKIVHMVFSF